MAKDKLTLWRCRHKDILINDNNETMHPTKCNKLDNKVCIYDLGSCHGVEYKMERTGKQYPKTGRGKRPDMKTLFTK